MRRSGGFVVAGISAIAVSAGIAVLALTDAPDNGRTKRTPSRLAEAGRPAPQLVRVGAPLRPNLRSLPSEDVHIEVNDGGRRLRFASVLANFGPGPLEVEPNTGDVCPPGQRHSAQVLFTDKTGDGRFDPGADRRAARTPAGCMLDHRAHKHWHFDAMARYALTRPGSTMPITSHEKVSFCLRDSRRTPVDFARPRKHYGDCGRNKVQGISPGWADVYKSDLPGQELELPNGLADGPYCLHSSADPLQLLREIDEDDNAAVLSIVIRGDRVSAGEPSACTAG